MKSKKIMIRNIITTLTIAALILIGSAPYFAFAEPTQQTDSEVVKLATFDDSKVPEVSGGSVVLMNAGNGDIIYEKNSHQLREPASVTKVLNFLTIADVLDPKEKVTIPEKVERGGTIVDLQPGEILTVEQLMYCMMLKSGNDAAEVLGNLAGGDQKGFSEMMNAKAKSVGALDTDYKNPNGLNETEGTLNYTTAYDQAMIAKAAMQKKIIRKVVGTVEYKIPKTNKYEERDLVNSNACLWNDKRTVVIGDKNIPNVDLGLIQHVQKHVQWAVKLAEMIGDFHSAPYDRPNKVRNRRMTLPWMAYSTVEMKREKKLVTFMSTSSASMEARKAWALSCSLPRSRMSLNT